MRAATEQSVFVRMHDEPQGNPVPVQYDREWVSRTIGVSSGGGAVALITMFVLEKGFKYHISTNLYASTAIALLTLQTIIYLSSTYCCKPEGTWERGTPTPKGALIPLTELTNSEANFHGALESMATELETGTVGVKSLSEDTQGVWQRIKAAAQKANAPVQMPIVPMVFPHAAELAQTKQTLAQKESDLGNALRDKAEIQRQLDQSQSQAKLPAAPMVFPQAAEFELAKRDLATALREKAEIQGKLETANRSLEEEKQAKGLVEKSLNQVSGFLAGEKKKVKQQEDEVKRLTEAFGKKEAEVSKLTKDLQRIQGAAIAKGVNASADKEATIVNLNARIGQLEQELAQAKADAQKAAVKPKAAKGAKQELAAATAKALHLEQTIQWANGVLRAITAKQRGDADVASNRIEELPLPDRLDDIFDLTQLLNRLIARANNDGSASAESSQHNSKASTAANSPFSDMGSPRTAASGPAVRGLLGAFNAASPGS